MWNSSIVKNAIIFASKKHKGQEMIFPEGVPYSAHYFGVTLNAIRLAGMCEFNIDWDFLVCCSILHDTLEDTSATFDEINDVFGLKIANGVLALTKNPTLKKSEQMLDSLKRIKEQPVEIAIVKIADRLFNISDRVPLWSEEKQKNYKIESQLICDWLGYVDENIKNILQNQIDNY